MKKTNLLVLSAAAALLATSCSKDQVTQSNPGEGIRFSAITDKATKASEVTAATSIPDFQVYARFTTSTTLNFDEVYTNDNYPSGAPTTGVWTPASGKTYYWPNDASESVKFIAFSPSDFGTAYGVSSITPPSGATGDFSVSNITPPLHASEQKDVLIAQKSSTKAANVQLNFQHVFSQIALQASCGDENMKVTVYGAKIYGFSGTSSLTWKNTDSDINAIWNNTSADKTTAYMVGGSAVVETVVLSDAATPIMGANGTADGNFMVIPQNITNKWDYTNNGGAYIAVLCKIEKNVGSAGSPQYEQVFPAAGYKCGFTAVPLAQNFERAKKYTITLQFFTDGGGGGVTPPDTTDPSKPVDPDIDPGDPNTPILAPMKFTVNVSDWTQGTVTENNGNLPLQ